MYLWGNSASAAPAKNGAKKSLKLSDRAFQPKITTLDVPMTYQIWLQLSAKKFPNL